MVLDAPEQLKEAPIRRLKDELEQLEPGVLKQERDGENMAELSHEHLWQVCQQKPGEFANREGGLNRLPG